MIRGYYIKNQIQSTANLTSKKKEKPLNTFKYLETSILSNEKQKATLIEQPFSMKIIDIFHKFEANISSKLKYKQQIQYPKRMQNH